MSIYKYTPTHIPKVNILKCIFEDKKLFFSNSLKLNDPFELKPHIKKYEVPENDMVLNMGANLINSSGEAHKSHYATANHQLKDVGILSLTNRENNLMLWAHYADSHKGIVIEFDEKHPFFTDSNYLHPYLLYPLEEVIYELNRPSINSDEYYDKETFHTQSEDWKYEEEYRITIYVPTNNPHSESEIYVLFPTELIKSVYIGCMATSDTNQYIKNLKTQEQWKHLDIYNMDIDEKEYKLNPIKFNNITK